MTTTPEFSRPLSIEGIVPDKVRKEDIAATPAECAALAPRLGLRDLSEFKAALTIRRVSGGAIVRVGGKIEAEVVQACVVSLQDVHERVEAEFETFFTQDKVEVSGKELEFNAEDEDSPEMVVNGMIDLGEVATQYLSLNLNPYPRAPGVSLAAQLAEAGMEVKNRPFAVLEGLKAEKGDKN